MNKPTNIDEYIESNDESVKPLLIELREVIRQVIPEATEKLAWNMPTWHKHKNVIHFDAFDDHVNVYIGKDLTEKYRNLHPDFKFTTRGVKLFYDQPLPVAMIQSMARDGYDIEIEKYQRSQRK